MGMRRSTNRKSDAMLLGTDFSAEAQAPGLPMIGASKADLPKRNFPKMETEIPKMNSKVPKMEAPKFEAKGVDIRTKRPDLSVKAVDLSTGTKR